MRYTILFAALVFLAAAVLSPDSGRNVLSAPPAAPVFPLAAPTSLGAVAAAPAVWAPATAPPEDAALFLEAARAAWTYVDRQYQPATGLVNSVAEYPYATVWDIASAMAAMYSARELGLVEQAEYDRRMRTTLQTLRTMRLYEGVAFNKNYSTRTGRMAGRDDRDRRSAEEGYGWSVTDIGRLLVWLRIIADTQPQHAAAAEAVARRLDYRRLVADGYLWGEDRSPRLRRKRRYKEGMIPYEQYAAAGFAAWGHRADSALSLAHNAAPMEVMGVPLVTDRRGHGRLTSEPLVLIGMELGWDAQMRQLSVAALAAQEARWRQKGQVTVVSEDAIPRAPHYFYYYTIHSDGVPFAIEVQSTRARLTGPRWISAKAAYAWHALLPGDYTRRAVSAVARARSPVQGWNSGVYEGNGRSTDAPNVNTAAVILQSALFHARGGRPLMEPARPATTPSAAPAPSPR